MTIGITSSSFGVNPVYVNSATGNDANSGQEASPVQSFDRAYQLVSLGKTITLAGTVGVPLSYTAAQPVAKSLTILAANTGGAKFIAGTDPLRAMFMGASGVTVDVIGVIMDPSISSGSGASARAVELLSPASLYTVNFTSVTFQNWGAGSYGLYAPNANWKCAITFTDCIWTNGLCTAATYFPQVNAVSSIAIVGGSATITNIDTSGFGVHRWLGRGVGCTATVTDHDVTGTVDASVVANQMWGIHAVGISTVVDGGIHLGGSSTGGQYNCIRIEQGASPLNIDGSRIQNAIGGMAGTNPAGGIVFDLGGDGGLDKTLANNVVMHNLSTTGSSTTVEAVVFASCTDATMSSCTIGAYITSGAKDCIRWEMFDCVLTDLTTFIVDRGNNDCSIHDNTCIHTNGATAGLFVAINTDSDTSRTITAITKANPAQVTTSTAHLYATGQYAYITSVSGMTQINGQTAQVTVVDATNFTIAIDSTGFSNYTTGGNSKIASHGNVYSTNSYTVSDSTGATFATEALGNTSNTFDHNTYTKSGGSLNANPWQILGVNYATFAAYRAAVEPTAINGGGLP